MSLFIPHPSDIGDKDVPAVCPACGAKHTLENLSRREKCYLLDSTPFWELTEELSMLQSLQRIVDDFPHTEHPLVRCKIGKGDPRASFRQMLHQLSENCEIAKGYLENTEERETSRRPAHPSDKHVDARIDLVPGLRDELSASSFDLADRLRFLNRELPEYNMKPVLVSCHCNSAQFLVLDEEYYRRLG